MLWKILARKISRKILRALVVMSDDEKALQTLQVKLPGGEVWSGLERLQNFGFTSRPKKGAQVGVALLNEDDGFAFVVDDRRYRVKALAAGDVAMYDAHGNVLKFTKDKVFLSAVVPVDVDSPLTTFKGAVVFDKTVQVKGNAQFDAGVTNLGKDISAGHGHTGDSGGQINGVT